MLNIVFQNTTAEIMVGESSQPEPVATEVPDLMLQPTATVHVDAPMPSPRISPSSLSSASLLSTSSSSSEPNSVPSPGPLTVRIAPQPTQIFTMQPQVGPRMPPSPGPGVIRGFMAHAALRIRRLEQDGNHYHAAFQEVADQIQAVTDGMRGVSEVVSEVGGREAVLARWMRFTMVGLIVLVIAILLLFLWQLVISIMYN